MEITTAMIIMTTLSTNPIAVRIESKENTASTSMIWMITALNPEYVLVLSG